MDSAELSSIATPLARSFYERNTAVVAFELIGKILNFIQNGILFQGKIVETEAYFGLNDPASHAFRGPTPRTKVMFGPAGISYVYFTYGNHHCINVVTEKEDTPGAVLIRALEPLTGTQEMKKRRKMSEIKMLTNGPGKLTQAFGITRDDSGKDLTQNSFCISDESQKIDYSIKATTRIGISHAKEMPYRFYLISNPYVSVK